ncbi:MipA/OmpV family protein [Salinarimonas chemoclinalis]|uniref:MipA/OmpV family protein n=1 Tax=Salinarimonas chemoclinalis TaxID=3241599 RepID=UPI003558BF6E
MPSRPLVLLAGAALGALVTTPATALDFLRGDWTVTVGARGAAVPVFEGSDEMRFRPLPIFSVRRAGTRSQWKAPDDGLRLGLLEHDRLRVGISGGFRGAREESASADLRGLGDVRWAGEIGVFAEIWASDVLRLSVDVRRGFNGHDGILTDLGADWVVRPEPSFALSIGPRVRLASNDYMDTYFGVDALQSARSGLPVYDPDPGLRSIGMLASAQVALTQSWTAMGYARYDRLMGDVADAPLVRFRGSRDQFGLGVGLSYSFDVSPFGPRY